MRLRHTLAITVTGFFLAGQFTDAARTCRVVYPESPRNAPKVAHLFDGRTSKLVTLPSKNLSEVVELPDGDITIAMTSKKIIDPKNVPSGIPILRIPKRVRDFYIIISPDPKNQELPIKMNLVEAGGEKFKPGQTLWFNLTKHKIISKMGDEMVRVPPQGKTISNDPISEKGYYVARIAYQANGSGAVAPVTEQQWWHDPGSRHLGFIVDTGGKLPRLYYFRDFRLSNAEKLAIAEADPKDLEPVIEEGPIRSDGEIPEELRGDDFPPDEQAKDEPNAES